MATIYPFVAELHRARACLLLSADASQSDAAEANLRRALGGATQQEALALGCASFENSPSGSSGRSERQTAAALLAPVYTTFSEGFETPDLLEAKRLLDELQT